MSLTTTTTLPDGTIAVDVRVECAHGEMVPIEKVIGNPRNPNTHPRQQIEMLAKIIAAQGWRAPIAVSKRSGFVVRGHGRLEAARLLGVPTVPVDFQDYANEAEEWADMIADNRIAELAETDLSALTSMMKEISDQSEAVLSLTGFTDVEVENILNEYAYRPDDLPPAEVSGADDSCGRFIFVYEDEEQKKALCDRLGIDGEKVVYTLSDISTPDESM